MKLAADWRLSEEKASDLEGKSIKIIQFERGGEIMRKNERA